MALGLIGTRDSEQTLTGVGEESAQIRFGVLAFRSTDDTFKRWQPVANYLGQALPGYSVTLIPLDYPELKAAVIERRVDLVLTQPVHYVALSLEQELYSPLATLIEVEEGLNLSQFGGVIVTRAGHDAIQSLSDLKGRRIAASTRESLGGYLAQAFELDALGIRAHQFQLLETVKQDAVLAALAAGEVDAGFVRTGLLEQMQREGKLDLADYRILKAEGIPDYPLHLSTRLYPQWALAAMPWLDAGKARQIASAVLRLPADDDAARAANISGFTIPGDYRAVDQLMQAMRIPPYDERVSLRQIWLDYAVGIVLGVGVLLSIIVWLLIMHLREHWRLGATEERLQLAVHRQNEAQRIAHVGSWEMDGTSGQIHWSDAAKSLFEQDPERLAPNYESLLALVHSADRGRLERALQTSVQEQKAAAIDYRLVLPDGSIEDGRIEGGRIEGGSIEDGSIEDGRIEDGPIEDGPIEGGRNKTGRIKDVHQRWENRYDKDGQYLSSWGTLQDVSEQRQIEKRLRQAASVFEHANEGIIITDAHGTILDVNAAFSRVTCYSRDEVIGKNPRILNSGRQGPEFYQAMWFAILRQGRWTGEIWNRRKTGELYTALLTISAVRDEFDKLQQFVALFSDITEMRRHQDELEHIAHFDALTQLPNRLLLADRLQQAILQAGRRDRMVAVIYIDLDGFKVVNDTYGHEMGDAVLIKLATRMKQVLRDGDTLSRLGGDEFVAVLNDLADQEGCQTILQRLLETTSQPVWNGDLEIKLSASLGVSFYRPGDDNNPDYLLRQADQAMYQAKQFGKNRYYIFDAAQDKALRGRREVKERIKVGLENGEFVLHYQPKTNMRTGQVTGAEALLRWQHPEAGLLLPAHFLPVVEDDDLIIDIGNWVIAQALAQVADWRGAGLALPVSVNVAGRHLQAPDFLDNLESALNVHPGLNHCLELEVLETSALEDVAQVSRVIQSCADLGVSVALDDFGTGYSSLIYLKRLPARTLKIDQSFVRDMLEDPDDLAILDGILGMAIAFQRDVIAEGVESQAHGEMLLRMGCDHGQGYAIARPMPAAAIPDWIKSWQPKPVCNKRTRVSRDSMPVLFAMVEHRAWVANLRRYLRGEVTVPPALDEHQCRFGRWLERFGKNQHAGNPVFERILHRHQEIHERAVILVEAKRAGTLEEPYVCLYAIDDLRDDLVAALQELLDPVPAIASRIDGRDVSHS